MSRRTTGRLDERRLAAQKSFLVRVENADERNLRKIETFAEQIDPDQDVEIGRAQSAQNFDALDRFDPLTAKLDRVIDLMFERLERDFWIEKSSGPNDLLDDERRAGRVHIEFLRWLIGKRKL